MQQRKARILVLSPIPHHYGGLANNMKLYLSSKLRGEYHLICLNTVAPLRREKDPDRPSLITGLYSVAVLARLLYMLVTVWPDLVYMKAGTKWGFSRELCMILLCKLFRRKLLCHLHSRSAGTLFLDHQALRRVFRWTMRFPDKVIVLSDQLKKEFGAALIRPNKLVVIDNIVDITVFDRQLKDRVADSVSQDEPIKVLFVGRLSRNKGLGDLFDAVRFIVSRYQNVRFQLAGLALNETEETEIRRYCSETPFNEHVTLLGGIQGAVKIKTFIESDIFVLPTRNDNVPNAILEAFAAGLPVVSTNVGQIPDMVKDGINGFIVEPGDSKKLAERLIRLIESPELRHSMGKRNYRKSREKYSVEVGVEKMRKIFDDLLPEVREAGTEVRVSKAWKG